MSRPLFAVLLGLVLAGCWDFLGLIDQCKVGQGVCADAGAGGGGGGGGGGGNAGPLCATDSGLGATVRFSDGGTAFCFNGFQWENPLPQGNDLGTVSARAPDDVWVGGRGAMLMHWDGQAWESLQGMAPVAPVDWAAVSGIRFLPDGGGWLVGRPFGPHAFNGTRWVEAPASPPTNGWFFAALGVSPNGRHVVGVSLDGTAFAPPDWQPWAPSAGTTEVGSVAILDSGECLFVGVSYDNGQMANTRALHACDGGVALDLGRGDPLSTAWADGPSAWAYTSANSVFSLPLGGSSNPLASTTRDVNWFGAARFTSQPGGYLVGSDKDIANMSDATKLPITLEPATSPSLYDVVAFEDGGGWAVGQGGALVQATSSGWRWAQRGHTETLYGLHVGDSQVVAVGERGIIFRLTSASFHPTGSTLRDVTTLVDGGLLLAAEGQLVSGSTPVFQENTAFNGLYSGAGGQHWAVGTDNVVANNLDGGAWALATQPDAGPDWWKVHGQGGYVVVVGEPREVASFVDGALAETASLQGDFILYGVWVESQSAGAWVVGGGNLVYRFQGSSLTPVTLPDGLGGPLYDVWGFAANDVWAVGENGLVLHYDGAAWSRIESGSRSKLERVRGRVLPNGEKELFIVGGFGATLRYRY
ncbi:MAG: hypothetical protein AB1938_31570 [Myxococcota bacterium]